MQLHADARLLVVPHVPAQPSVAWGVCFADGLTYEIARTQSVPVRSGSWSLGDSNVDHLAFAFGCWRGRVVTLPARERTGSEFRRTRSRFPSSIPPARSWASGRRSCAAFTRPRLARARAGRTSALAEALPLHLRRSLESKFGGDGNCTTYLKPFRGLAKPYMPAWVRSAPQRHRVRVRARRQHSNEDRRTREGGSCL